MRLPVLSLLACWIALVVHALPIREDREFQGSEAKAHDFARMEWSAKSLHSGNSSFAKLHRLIRGHPLFERHRHGFQSLWDAFIEEQAFLEFSPGALKIVPGCTKRHFECCHPTTIVWLSANMMLRRSSERRQSTSRSILCFRPQIHGKRKTSFSVSPMDVTVLLKKFSGRRQAEQRWQFW